MMKRDQQANGASHGRRGLRHHLTATVPRLSQFAVEHLLLLPLGALVALLWANVAPESYYQFTFSIAFAVNDVAMAFFFALVTKEIVEATAPGGLLHSRRSAVLPVIAAIGAAALPALIYGTVVDNLDEPMLGANWPVTLAVDLAVGYFVARLLFRVHPVVPFFLLVGIASNGLGFVALAWLNPTRDIHIVGGAAVVVIALTMAAALRRSRVRSFWPYLGGPGVISWFGFFWSGLHPALALVPVMPFLPHAARDPGFFVDANPNAKDTLSQFENWWRYPAQVALFFFGLANAGVPMGALELGTIGLPLAVIAAKPVGILIGAGLARAAGLALPRGVGWRELIVCGLIAAIGFSVGLFFCTALVPPGQLRSEISMGVLLTVAAAPLALAAAWLLRVGRFSDGPQRG